jgi:hypothetical protein
MTKEPLKKWLEDPKKEYQEGLRLYIQYGKNDNLKKQFLVRENKFNKEKIVYELEKMFRHSFPDEKIKVKQFVEAVVQQPAASNKKNKKAEAQTEKEGKLIEIPKEVLLDALNNDRAALFNKKGILSNKLQEAKTNKERKALIAEIDQLESELSDIYEKIKHVEETGSLPVVIEKKKEDVLPEDRAKLAQMLTNARSRISKNRKKLEKFGNSPAGKEAKAKIDKDEKLISEIEQKIK